MTSLIKCAKCGKKPTVAATKGTWQDVATRPPPAVEARSGLPGSAALKATDVAFVRGLRDEGAEEDIRKTLDCPRAKPTAKTGVSPDIFSRLTDSSKYTGAHRERFDGEGHGRGLEGRDRILKASGHMPNAGILGDVPPQRDKGAGSACACGHLRVPSANFCAHCGAQRVSPATASPSTSPRPGAQSPASPRPRSAPRREVAREANVRPSPGAVQPPARAPSRGRTTPAGGWPALAGSEAVAEGEAARSSVDDVFGAYCGTKSDMDGRTFVKICKDCLVIDRKFTAIDADLIFSRVVPKGQRRIGLLDFLTALELAAKKKGVAVDSVHSAVLSSRGPILKGTVVEAVRFHDDTSTYTGVHANGGPDAAPKGLGTSRR